MRSAHFGLGAGVGERKGGGGGGRSALFRKPMMMAHGGRSGFRGFVIHVNKHGSWEVSFIYDMTEMDQLKARTLLHVPRDP
jgi:hypothetical protein